MEPAERRPRLGGSIYLRLQSGEDVLLVRELSLPVLERDSKKTRGIITGEVQLYDISLAGTEFKCVSYR